VEESKRSSAEFAASVKVPADDSEQFQRLQKDYQQWKKKIGQEE